MDLSEETWLPVPCYEGLYEVSSRGRVRSVDRVLKRGCRWGGMRLVPHKGRVLKQQPGNTDLRYLYVCLHDHFGRTSMRSVHTLMLEAFVGPRPPGMEGCHRNDVGHDNYIENLRWDTRGGNLRDRYRNRRELTQ